MKKIICLFSFVAVLLIGCAKQSDFENLEARISALEQLCAQMNTNITSLQTLVSALQENDYITSITPVMEGDVEIGYTINFLKNASITIFHGTDGIDGQTPIISVKQDTDGLYYWTVNGEWLLDDDGNKIKAEGVDGITPQLKIEDNFWFLSYDGGVTWTNAGRACGEPLFSSVTIENSLVTFVLADGTTFSIPCYSPVDISFDIEGGVVAVVAGEQVVINYTLSGTVTDNTIVTASSDGNYIVKVEPTDDKSGKIVITCPAIYADGYINVIVYDGNGYSFVYVINFFERVLTFSSGLEYRVPSAGGEVTIPLTTNIDYSLQISEADAAWITINQTKASTRNETLSLTVAKNENSAIRQGVVSVLPTNGSEVPYCQIVITQSGDGMDDMIFTVNATPINDYTTYLPLSGTIDCYVDWGDGNVEHFTTSPVLHVYEGLSSGTAFDVTISGKVSALSSGSVPDSYKTSVSEVKQWGNTGLINMSNAFSGYSSLRSLPKDETMAFANVTNFDNAFSNCTGLTVVSKGLFDACANVISMKKVFFNCNALTNLPDSLFSGCINVTSFEGAFKNCKSLLSLPASLFDKCANVISFYESFAYCSGLLIVPKKLFSSCPVVDNFIYTFLDCIAITTIPEELFSSCTLVTSFYATFFQCTALKAIPEGLFLNCPNATNFAWVFRDCDALESIPAGIFDNNRKITDFSYAFYSCNRCEGESPYTVIDGVKYHLYERINNPDEFVTPIGITACFLGSSGLSDFSSIPSAWKSY